MTVRIPPGPPPNQTEPRKEWRDWFDSIWRSIGGELASSLFNKLNTHIADLDNPHAVTWGQVVSTGSSIATIQNKSHTLLDDIGTYTHNAIDSHIDDLFNPHETTIDQIYAQGSDVYLTNRDPIRYSLLGA